ncbi:MAG TPA: ATP-binding protein [Thiolinea sp.]|nr:ATP-binding protein [Thiolinea sp.]
MAISLSLLHLATRDAEFFRTYGKALVYLNGFILLVLGIAILTNLIRAIYQWHTRQAGSRFTLRLMVSFLILSMIPVAVVVYFSMNFIGKNVGQQLDVRIARALDDAVELSHLSLSIRSSAHLQDLSRLAEQIQGKGRLEVAALMDNWRAVHDAQEAILISDDQRILVTSVDEVAKLIPLFPIGDLIRTMNRREDYSHLEPTGEDGTLFIRVATHVRYGSDNRNGILTAMFPFSQRESSLASSVSSAQEEYRTISFNQEGLKNTFRLALLVISVLTVLFSLWAAFLFSRRLTQPVRDLVEGTLAVASGDLQKKLPVSDRDDFSLLARSFNTMTKRLSSVQQEREQARRQLQQEHDYLFVVLEHLSSGVVTLDEEQVIRRVNSAASLILGQPLDKYLGQHLSEAFSTEALKGFLLALKPWLDQPQTDWQAEINVPSERGRRVLVCRGAGLPYDSMQQKGYVLVFEDVTDVVQAEHDAAWSEVARRLAHEIKNPLTPIQLSAERLSRKLGKSLDEESADFLNRMTRTIIQQVDTLKAMVNAFSEYAKAPALVVQTTNLNQIVREVTELYIDNPQKVRVVLEEQALPLLELDPHRIRQLLVNLVKNALEAIGDGREDGRILIRTRVENTLGEQQVVLCLHDNGPGIPTEILPHLFEPYVTTKHKGTGLGLAIVKKIVEEHNGSLAARNAEPNGAIIIITFPLTSGQDARS